jgi:DNA-binding cell septation regulator SpoVG
MPTPRAARAVASNWKSYTKGTLRGFFTLELSSGLVIHNLSLHVKADSRWVGMPATKYTKDDGTVSYTPILEFTSRGAADRFRDLAIEALKELGVEV